MKSKLILLLFLGALLGAPFVSRAQSVPELISYQGLVSEVGGGLVGSGAATNRKVIFRVWKDSTSVAEEDLVYSEEQVVAIFNGEFSVLIGAGSDVTGNPLPFSEASKGPSSVNITDAISGTEVYLGVTVDDGTAAPDSEISPRQQMVSTAFAFRTKVADLAEVATVAESLNSANDIGIFTDTPAAPLHVSGNSIFGGNLVPDMTPGGNILNLAIGEESDGSENGIKFYEDSTAGMSLGYDATAANSGEDAIKIYSKAGTSLLSVEDGGDIEIPGRLGIGRSPALGRLDVAGGESDTDALYVRNSSADWKRGGIVLHNDGPYGFRQIVRDTNSFTTAKMQFAVVTQANPTQTWWTALTVMRDRIGIHYGNPAYSLDLRGTSIPMRVSSTTGTAEKIIFSDTDTTRGMIGAGSTSSFLVESHTSQRLFTVGNDGRVCIGTDGTPDYPLDVREPSVSSSTSNATYFTKGNSNLSNGTTTRSISINANGYVRATGFIASSDERIKEGVERSRPDSALEVINALKVSDYEMKDRVRYGDVTQRGFIAQEVEAVMPEAVTQVKDVIPDVYEVAESFEFDEEANTLTITLSAEHSLKPEEVIRVITDQDRAEVEIVEIPDEKSLVVSGWESAPKQVFVFGREVEDFRSVDYNRIYTTGIAAIQELKAEKDAELAERDATIEALSERLAALEAEAKERDREVAEMRELDQQREARLIALEKAFAVRTAPETKVASVQPNGKAAQ